MSNNGDPKGKGKDKGQAAEPGDAIMVRDFLRSEAPLCWRRPPDMAEIAINANRLGISQQQTTAYLVLEVPDTPLGWAYQDHARRSTRPGQLGVIVTAQVTFEAGGVGRLSDFEYSMETQGRPCHFAFVYGPATPLEMLPIDVVDSSSDDSSILYE
jgi:hypothetical protein